MLLLLLPADVGEVDCGDCWFCEPEEDAIPPGELVEVVEPPLKRLLGSFAGRNLSGVW